LRVRREALADDSLVVVRGGHLDRGELVADAERAFRRFGEYAVSVLGVPSDEELDALGRTALRRYEVLTVTTAGALRLAGLELRPTFRRPHYSVMLRDLNEDVERLIGCQTGERINPHHVGREAD
jgi:hypothetical protein